MFVVENFYVILMGCFIDNENDVGVIFIFWCNIGKFSGWVY